MWKNKPVTLEQDVPLPDDNWTETGTVQRLGRGIEWPFKWMKPGDSFAIDYRKPSQASRAAQASYGTTKFIYRIDKASMSIRFWRVT